MISTTALIIQYWNKQIYVFWDYVQYWMSPTIYYSDQCNCTFFSPFWKKLVPLIEVPNYVPSTHTNRYLQALSSDTSIHYPVLCKCVKSIFSSTIWRTLNDELINKPLHGCTAVWEPQRSLVVLIAFQTPLLSRANLFEFCAHRDDARFCA